MISSSFNKSAIENMFSESPQHASPKSEKFMGSDCWRAISDRSPMTLQSCLMHQIILGYSLYFMMNDKRDWKLEHRSYKFGTGYASWSIPHCSNKDTPHMGDHRAPLFSAFVQLLLNLLTARGSLLTNFRISRWVHELRHVGRETPARGPSLEFE